VSRGAFRRLPSAVAPELAYQLTHSSDPAEQKRLKDEMARMTFGEP